MAKISKSGIGTNNIIHAEHLTRIIDALDGTGSAEICATGSFTGSFTGEGNFSILNVDNLTVFQTASVNYLETIYETASVLYSSGSTKFGNTLDDTHEFTGSVFITGSDVVLTDGIFTGNGSGLTDLQSANLDFNTVSYGGITLQLGQTDATPAFNLVDATNYPYSSLTGIPAGIVSSSAQFTDLNAPFTGSFTGSFVGDGSGLTNVPTPNAVVTASNAANDDTIEFLKGGGGTFSVTVNNVENASTASYIFGNNVVGPVSDAVNAVSASYVPGSGVDGAVELANTASYVQGSNVDGAVANATNSVSSSYAVTASHALGGNGTFNGTFSGSFSGSYIGDGSQLTGISTGSAETASYVQGSNVDGSVTSANTASYISGANVAGPVASSSYTETASYVPPGVGGIYDGSGTVPSSTVVSLTNNFQALEFVSGSNSRLLFNESISTLTVNNSNANYDFVIAGQTDTSLFKADASNNTIGIGSLGSSNTKLYVAGGTTHPYGMQVQAGGNSTFGYGILARTTNVSGSAEGGRFESATVTSHAGAQHLGIRAWADYGNSFTCGIQGSAGGSGITYASTIMGVSAYIGTTDNVPSNNTSYAFHGRNRRTKGNIKYGMYTTVDGTMQTASATTYAAYYNNGALSPSGSAHGLYVASNSTSLNNYGIRVSAFNGTNNYALVADSGHVILNESGGDWDFRVEGDTDQNLFFVDASADGVAVGKNTANAKFDVNGNAIISGSFTTTGARVRNTRTITLTDANFGGGAATLNADDDIVLIIDNTTTTPGVGTGSLDISALLNSVNGRCIELVKVKDGTGGGIILTAQTMAGQELYLNGASQTFGTRTVCTDLAMSLTIMASGATPSGSAWGTGW